MSKEKSKRIKLTDRHYLEGTQFDWIVVTVSNNVNADTGKKTKSERRHYFPRLTQIATHLVSEQVKDGPGNYDDLVDAINRSTKEITEKLMGVEERLARLGNDTVLADTETKEVDDGEIKEKQPRKSAGTATRRRRRKKA